MLLSLFTSPARGASFFATWRTNSNGIFAEPLAAIEAVTAPSKAHGTSTPCWFLPSARRNSTWYRLIVTWLFEVGERVTFFIVEVTLAVAMSSRTVGHGLAALHGAGVVKSTWTSELRGLGDMLVTVTRTGARPSRTTSPHEMHPMRIAAVIAAVRMYLIMAMS